MEVPPTRSTAHCPFIVLGNIADSIGKMEELNHHGISFAMDDFGTGHSLLAYRKQLPLDQMKIDQSFVRDISSDPNDAVIVKTIIAMGRSLGPEVIAEGVETGEQRLYLERHGCGAFQGYPFGLPLSVTEFAPRVADEAVAQPWRPREWRANHSLAPKFRG